MSPTERYEYFIRHHHYRDDPAQRRVLAYLERIHESLTVARGHQGAGRFFGLWPASTPRVQGLYLWGGVGRGKTYLVDSLCECLPACTRRRVHFYTFMRDIHRALGATAAAPQSVSNAARTVIQGAALLCLDEFFVDDVADAMLLKGVLETFLEDRIVLVFTSNLPPDDLYRNGMHRERFVPVIELIKRYTDVVALDGDQDYRYGRALHPQRWVMEEGKGVHPFVRHFETLAGCPPRPGVIRVNGRRIDACGVCGPVAWFGFDALCAAPRSSADYFSLAATYRTVLLSGGRALGHDDEDVARRFLQLVDALYDRRVELFFSSTVPLFEIYRGRWLAFEFQRAISRLHELLAGA